MDDYEEEHVIITAGRKSSKKIPDFDKYDLPECIKTEAKNVYQTLGISTHEGVKQKQIMYASFYIAGIICDMPQLPERLRDILKLDARQATGANTYIVTAQMQGICSKKSILTPLMIAGSFIKQYFPENYKILMNMAEKIWTRLEKAELHKSKQLQILAAYIIKELSVVKIEDICKYFYVREKDIKM